MRTIVAAVVFVVTASPLLLAQLPKYALPGTPKAPAVPASSMGRS